MAKVMAPLPGLITDWHMLASKLESGGGRVLTCLLGGLCQMLMVVQDATGGRQLRLGMTVGGVVSVAIGSLVGGPVSAAAAVCEAPPNVGGIPLGVLARWGWRRGSGGRCVALTGPYGEPRPAGSSLILRCPSRHTAAPLPFRSTKDGIVDTPNVVINSCPLAPIEARWGIAVHSMGEKKYSVVHLDLHCKTSTILKGAPTPTTLRLL